MLPFCSLISFLSCFAAHTKVDHDWTNIIILTPVILWKRDLGKHPYLSQICDYTCIIVYWIVWLDCFSSAEAWQRKSVGWWYKNCVKTSLIHVSLSFSIIEVMISVHYVCHSRSIYVDQFCGAIHWSMLKVRCHAAYENVSFKKKNLHVFTSLNHADIKFGCCLKIIEVQVRICDFIVWHDVRE